MFSINFKPIPLEQLGDDGVFSAVGEIVFGNLREDFTSSLFAWTPGAYEAQWRHALTYVLEHKRPAVLVTEFNGKNAALWAWVLYPEMDSVYLQEHIFAFLEQPRVADPYEYESYVEPRQVTNEDGIRISTWKAPLADVEAFVATPQEQFGNQLRAHPVR